MGSLLTCSRPGLVGIGLRVNKKSNVIIRNLKISKVIGSTGDAIGIQESKNVWGKIHFPPYFLSKAMKLTDTAL